MNIIDQLSEKDKSPLKSFIKCFKTSYERFNTGASKLTSLTQILDLYEAGGWTEEDMFSEYLNHLHWSLEDEYFWEDNMEMFMYDNYFSGSKSLPEGGSWIKVRTEKGFELHFAKVSTRKRRWEELMEVAGKKYLVKMKGHIKGYNKTEISSFDLDKDKKQTKKIEQLEFEYKVYRIRNSIKMSPYEIRIKTSKTVTKYLLPYQYELIDGVDLYIKAYMEKTPGLKFKVLYSSIDDDKIFYLRTRGIPKEQAEIMCSLNSGYFIIDMNVMIDEYNKSFNSRLTFNPPLEDGDLLQRKEA